MQPPPSCIGNAKQTAACRGNAVKTHTQRDAIGERPQAATANGRDDGAGAGELGHGETGWVHGAAEACAVRPRRPQASATSFADWPKELSI